MEAFINEAARFMQEGGQFMWVIFGAGAVGLAVILERVIFFYVQNRTDSRALVAEILNTLRTGNARKAVEGLQGKSPLKNIFRVALQRWDHARDVDEVRKSVEEAAIKEVPRLSERISTLSLLANVATLTGLLGTIFGLQASFSSLKLAEGADKAAALASGISQAMNTTAMGLMVAIPCMVAYTYLANKKSSLTDDLDEATMSLIHYMETQA